MKPKNGLLNRTEVALLLLKKYPFLGASFDFLVKVNILDEE